MRASPRRSASIKARPRVRAKAGRGDWIAFGVIFLLVGAGWRWISRLETTPVWLVALAAFAAGVLVAIFCRRWIDRAMRKAGYVRRAR